MSFFITFLPSLSNQYPLDGNFTELRLIIAAPIRAQSRINQVRIRYHGAIEIDKTKEQAFYGQEMISEDAVNII